MLSREEILGADDLPREEVPVPEWGGSVFVRTLTATEKVEFSELEQGDFMSRLAALTVCDEEGELLFSIEDVEALGKKNGRAMQRIVLVSQRLNVMSDKSREDLEKNSPTGQTSDAT